MPADLWPARYAIAPIHVVLDERIPPAAFRCYVKLRALAHGKPTLRMDLETLLATMDISRTRLFEYARLLRLCTALLWSCSDSAFECSFLGADGQPEGERREQNPALGQNPGIPDSGNAVNTLFKTKAINLAIAEGGEIPQSRIPGNPGKRDLQKGRKRGDPRSTLPAILACKSVARMYPPLEIYDDIIAALGPTPDEQKLTQCRKAWVARGYSPTNWSWALEWYRDGIPERKGKNASTNRPNAYTGSRSATGPGPTAQPAPERKLDTGDIPADAVI